MSADTIQTELKQLKLFGEVSDYLRDQKRWTKDFKWNYCLRDHCAMALASEYCSTPVHTFSAESLFGITYECASTIFIRLGSAIGIWSWDVKPEHVADAIDAYLLTGKYDKKTLKRYVKLSWYLRLKRLLFRM